MVNTVRCIAHGYPPPLTIGSLSLCVLCFLHVLSACTLYSLLSALCSLLSALCSLLFTLYSLLSTLFSLYSPLFSPLFSPHPHPPSQELAVDRARGWRAHVPITIDPTPKETTRHTVGTHSTSLHRQSRPQRFLVALLAVLRQCGGVELPGFQNDQNHAAIRDGRFLAFVAAHIVSRFFVFCFFVFFAPFIDPLTDKVQPLSRSTHFGPLQPHCPIKIAGEVCPLGTDGGGGGGGRYTHTLLCTLLLCTLLLCTLL